MKKRYNNKRLIPKHTLEEYKKVYLRKMLLKDHYFLVDVSRDTGVPIQELIKWRLPCDATKNGSRCFHYWRYKLYVDAVDYAKERYRFYFNTVESKIIKSIVYDYIKEYTNVYKDKYKNEVV